MCYRPCVHVTRPVLQLCVTESVLQWVLVLLNVLHYVDCVCLCVCVCVYVCNITCYIICMCYKVYYSMCVVTHSMLQCVVLQSLLLCVCV